LKYEGRTKPLSWLGYLAQSHPKKSYNWRLGTSLTIRQHPPF